ncbi:ParA family protein [bacterium]|nr:ParA family protein [bacterium]
MDYTLTMNDLKRLTGFSAPEVRDRLARDHSIELTPSDLTVPPHAVRALLGSLGVAYKPKTIAFVNLKGGVGKTISAITFASRAVQYGFKTCLIDMDSQGSASLAFDSEPAEDDPIFYDVWQKPGKMVLPSLHQIGDGFYLLPSSLDNALLDAALANPAAQKSAVQGVCDELYRGGFDLVVIDCPPSLGTAVISTISAADSLVIPLANDPYSSKGLALTLAESRSIRSTFGLPEPNVHILFTRYDKRERLTEEAHRYLKKHHKKNLLPVVIPTSTRYAQALARRETVFAPGDYREARKPYDLLTRHLLAIFPSKGGK